MGQLFGKKPHQGPPPNVDQDDMALLDLKAQRDQLLASRRRVEARAQKAYEVARQLVAKDQRNQALLALRRQKQQKQLAEECQNHLNKLEEMIFSIEMAQTTKGTVEALKTGVAMMKRIQKEVGGVDQVQRLLGEQEEAMEAQQEINALLAGGGAAADDADMLAEFSKMQEEATLDALQKNGSEEVAEPAPAAPAAPVETPEEEEVTAAQPEAPASPVSAAPSAAPKASPEIAAPTARILEPA
ncbi:unnamed protein product [Effrenium voratum]|uniref:Charged multivesicular body protein 6 n=1 Tax=Effrenium voratum TaxID=2562239 RepID=A0AA36MV12_9DINO|nr:unnamed protein product [Effrenium voratum]CAJ1458775.1 unnamed protein product [Effrenium voratum]